MELGSLYTLRGPPGCPPGGSTLGTLESGGPYLGGRYLGIRAQLPSPITTVFTKDPGPLDTAVDTFNYLLPPSD